MTVVHGFAVILSWKMAYHVTLRKREVMMSDEDGNNFHKIQSYPTCVSIQCISSDV